jgi:hypothetical protein
MTLVRSAELGSVSDPALQTPPTAPAYRAPAGPAARGGA